VTLETLQNEKRSAILALARQHGASNVRVFGSVARRESGPSSDVDFLVDLDAGRDLFDLGGLQADLRDLLSTSVDLVEATCLHPFIRDRVLAESIPL
jgi:predicted nucleotidyltransferase